MKRKNSRIIIAIVALMLALATLVSCNASPSRSEQSSETDDAVEKATYHIIKDGKAEFKIIRPDGSEKELSDRILQLRNQVKQKYSTVISSSVDWTASNQENNTVESDSSVHEILIGSTNRAESRSAAEEYEDLYGFVIKVTNGKIVLWGNNLLQTLEAIQYFEDHFLQTDTPTVDEGFCFVHDLNQSGSVSAILAKDFNVVYPATRYSRDLTSANTVAKLLREITGTKPSSYADATAPKGKEILIGSTNREQSVSIDKTLNYMDYCVKVTSDCVVLIGGSPLATENAVKHFINALETGKITSLEQDYEYSFDFDPYIKDSLMYHTDSFLPVWANDFTVPDWLTDFEEKLYAMTCPTGRLTGDSHRGDTQNYPENSLPAILSAIMLGADSIEIDVRLTKDNVMVLMHDESLNRTTNWGEMRGKNGLPSSDKVQDWTYEQLQQLSLKHNGKVTQYKIPTAYEALSLFGGRTQVHFDCKIASIDKYSDVYLLAEELDAKECLIYYYGIDVMKSWVALNSGDTAFKETVDKVEGYLTLPGHGLRKRNFDLISKYGDNAEGWIKQYDSGCKMVFTDKIYDLCRYLAQNQEPIKK